MLNASRFFQRFLRSSRVSLPGGQRFLTRFYHASSDRKSQKFLGITRYKEGEIEKEFTNFLPKLIEAFACKSDADCLREVFKHQKWMLEYNFRGASLIFGLTIAASPRILKSPSNITDEDTFLSNMLGWCCELVIRSVALTDDYLDNAVLRGGAPCWSKVVGLAGANDILTMNIGAYRLIKTYFESKPYYHQLFETLCELTWTICIGEYLEMKLSLNNENSKGSLMDNFTIDNWNAIVKYKTEKTSRLAFELALRLNGYTDPECFIQTKELFVTLGLISQAQDDVCDCFADPSQSKQLTGSDIEEGRLTWVVVKALELANPAQVEFLKENYGKKDPECAKRVMDLYSELNLQEHYANYFKSMIEQAYYIIRRPESKLPESLCLYSMSLFFDLDSGLIMEYS